ncbi:hypothetical protein [Algihabitans albus]|uniref:hypothetical protein n=1 Tax=Algihabitans albus TaxID=2164067 RepID=UPI000E5D8A7F|nr:hypothetical protein [Algihabitans albus]
MAGPESSAAPKVPGTPNLPETAIVLGSAVAAATALIALAAAEFGATRADWPGLAAAAAALLFTGLAVLAGAPKGWRWVGATVCAHLGLHPWLAEEATRRPLTALAVAVVALTLWIALGVAGERRRQDWRASVFLGFLVGLSALVRPDLPALTLPLAALALWLAGETLRPGSSLALFVVAAVLSTAAGLALRWLVFGLDSLWQPGTLAPLAHFLQVNAVAATAGLSALALLGKRAWRPAALLFVPLLIFAGMTLWSAPLSPLRLESAQALYLPLLPLLAVAFGVLLARALDALPSIRPADDLGKTAALILGLVFILHLLALNVTR